MTTVGDLLEEYKECPAEGETPEVLTLTEKNGFVRQTERFNKRLAIEDTSKYKLVRRDSLAFNPYLLWAGAIARNTIVDQGVISPLYPTFRVREGCDPAWVAHLLLSEPMIARYDGIAYGSVPRRRRSSVKDFLGLEVPAEAPSLEEQERIAGILDKVEDLDNTIRRISGLFAVLLEREAQGAFSRVGSQGTPLASVADWGSGGTPRRANAEFFGPGVPWLSISDLNDGVVDDAKESLTQAGIDNSSAKVVPAGTVFIAMYGSIGKLGIAGREMCTSQAIAFAKPHADVLDRDYLFYYLLKQRPELIRLGRGGTQSNIGQKDLKQMTIPLPSLEEQREISQRLAYIESRRNELGQMLERLSALRSALQYRAFRGEL